MSLHSFGIKSLGFLFGLYMIWQGGRAAENGHANLACLAFLAGLVMFGAARLIAARADAEAERLGKDNQEQEGGRE